jgi:putative transposase
MISVLVSLLLTLRGFLCARTALHVELLALRHQIHVLERSRPRRLRLTRTDRLLWVWISRVWHDWQTALVIVKPETVIAWHRRGVRLVWTWKSRRHVGRATVPLEVRTLIRTMSETNPLWGAPRIHGELLKLGIEVGQAASPSTWSGGITLRHRPGVRSCETTWARSWRRISLWFRLRRAAS